MLEIENSHGTVPLMMSHQKVVTVVKMYPMFTLSVPKTPGVFESPESSDCRENVSNVHCICPKKPWSS